MGLVVDFVDHPAMLVWVVSQLGKSCIFEPEPRPRVVRLREDAHNSMHQLVQQTAVRDDQISGRLALEKIVLSLPRAQEQFPIPFPI